MHSMYLIEVYKRLLVDIRFKTGGLLGVPVEISYDWILIEGPKLDKELLMYLEGRRDRNIGLPLWLLPVWDRFLLTDEAVLLWYVRLALVFCYKAEHEPNDEQVKTAQADFEYTDSMCEVWSEWHSNCYAIQTDWVMESARRSISQVLYKANWKEITPKHGPGGIYPSRKPWRKSNFSTIYSEIEKYYPYCDYFCLLPGFWAEAVWHRQDELIESECITANLVCVPKDSRGPRLICVHPAESIWIQQGQRQVLEREILSSPFTRGRINFTDQTVNGNLALESSRSREFVTLDLREASDRISSYHVRNLFGDFIYDILSCSRATHVKLLDGRVIELKKWAPMGNALTFPVQSLIFYSVIHAGIRSLYGDNCTDIYVFGDDIVFPTKYYDGVIKTLVRFGFVPNYGKTFVAGSFRESCGVDAYKGVDITPLRVRRYDVNTLAGIQSSQDLAVRLRTRGFDTCATFIYDAIRQSLKTRYGMKYPTTLSKDFGGLAEYVDMGIVQYMRHEKSARKSRALQRLEVRCPMVRGLTMSVRNGDWYHLQDSLLRLTHMGDMDSDRGTEYPVPYRTRLQYGWAACT